MLPLGDDIKLLAWICGVARFEFDRDEILSEVSCIRINGQAFSGRALERVHALDDRVS